MGAIAIGDLIKSTLGPKGMVSPVVSFPDLSLGTRLELKEAEV